MDFKTAMEHYQAGNPTEEERRLVEEELKKSQLIAEYLDSQWEPAPAAETAPKTEMKQLRRSLRKRNALIVCTSLLLVAVLLFGTVQVAIPALEQLYWDPTTVSYGTEAGTDLDMTLAAYDDLFSPNTCFRGTRITHTGFASYSLAVQRWAGSTYETSESYGTLEKGELFLPDEVWEHANFRDVGSYWMDSPESVTVNRQSLAERLSQLPEFVQIGAYVTFTEDKTLEEAFDFRDEICNENINRINQTGYWWTAIRHSADTDNTVRCGISSESYTDSFSEVNDIYPAFSPNQAYRDQYSTTIMNKPYAHIYEEHFKSLLQYLDNQLNQGTGLPAPASGTGEVDPEYYAKALAYVEENGVMAYGCYISASPQSLLEIMEREDVLIVIPTEGWLNI